jgi:hypothetical protein
MASAATNFIAELCTVILARNVKYDIILVHGLRKKLKEEPLWPKGDLTVRVLYELAFL